MVEKWERAFHVRPRNATWADMESARTKRRHIIPGPYDLILTGGSRYPRRVDRDRYRLVLKKEKLR